MPVVATEWYSIPAHCTIISSHIRLPDLETFGPGPDYTTQPTCFLNCQRQLESVATDLLRSPSQRIAHHGPHIWHPNLETFGEGQITYQNQH